MISASCTSWVTQALWFPKLLLSVGGHRLQSHLSKTGRIHAIVCHVWGLLGVMRRMAVVVAMVIMMESLCGSLHC